MTCPIPILSLDAERARAVPPGPDDAARGVPELLDAFRQVHDALGAGFHAEVYRRALLVELAARGVRAEQDVPYGVRYRGRHIGGYLADVVVGRRLVALVRTPDAPMAATERLVRHLLRAAGVPTGIVLWCGESARHQVIHAEGGARGGMAQATGAGARAPQAVPVGP